MSLHIDLRQHTGSTIHPGANFSSRHGQDPVETGIVEQPFWVCSAQYFETGRAQPGCYPNTTLRDVMQTTIRKISLFWMVVLIDGISMLPAEY